MLLTLNGFVFGASYGAPKERFSKTCSLHPSDAVQGLGCSPTSILQRKNGIYIRVKTPLVSTMRLLKTPPKFDNHFARMIVRFQAQLEADGCFSARKSSEFAFRCKQNEPIWLSLFAKVFRVFSRNLPKVACFQNFLLTRLDFCGNLLQQFNITYLLRVPARLPKEPEQVFNFLIAT